MAELRTGGSRGTGLGRHLGQHERDVLLRVLRRYLLPCALPGGAEQAEKGEKGRDHESSVHQCWWP